MVKIDDVPVTSDLLVSVLRVGRVRGYDDADDLRLDMDAHDLAVAVQRLRLLNPNSSFEWIVQRLGATYDAVRILSKTVEYDYLVDSDGEVYRVCYVNCTAMVSAPRGGEDLRVQVCRRRNLVDGLD